MAQFKGKQLTSPVSLTGSFSGSFFGNGSGLTNITASAPGTDGEILFSSSSLVTAEPLIKVNSFNSSLHISGSTSQTRDNVVSVDIAGSDGNTNKLKVTKEGILALGGFDTLPTPITGGIVFKNTGEFYLGS